MTHVGGDADARQLARGWAGSMKTNRGPRRRRCGTRRCGGGQGAWQFRRRGCVLGGGASGARRVSRERSISSIAGDQEVVEGEVAMLSLLGGRRAARQQELWMACTTHESLQKTWRTARLVGSRDVAHDAEGNVGVCGLFVLLRCLRQSELCARVVEAFNDCCPMAAALLTSTPIMSST